MQDAISIKGKVRWTKTRQGQIVEQSDWADNLVMLGTDTGKDLILDRLIGNNTYSLNITHGDIGTGDTAPAISDTALTTPVARTSVALSNISSNTVTFDFFFADGDLANGTYREFGCYVDGTATVSTGKIFNHVLFASSLVKSTGEDITVSVTFTLT
jgi:hypothetical protein